MSPKKGTGSTGSANPGASGSLTPAQVQEWSYVLKKLDDNKWVVPAVLTAGLAGLFEIIHLVFLAIRFVVHWSNHSWSF
jgi:hypothetical protein